MSFVKNMMEHDLTLLQTLDGQYIMYTPKQGNPRVIDGMLQEHTQIIPGGHVEMVATETILHVRAINAYDMEIGEKIAVDSQAYGIVSIRFNNEGITELLLEKL